MHRCAAEAPVHFSWQADAATRSAEGPGAAGTRRFQPAARTGRRGGRRWPAYCGSRSRDRAVGYRKPLAHDNLALIRVLDFQQQLIEPHAAVQRDGPLLLVQPGHGAKRVFQSVGQNGAQLGVRNAQRCGEAELRRQPDAVLLRLFRKRGAQQIDQLVFTVAPEATR